MLEHLLNQVIAEDAETPPDRLWHYTDAKGLMGIVEHRKLRATHIHYLNDSNEQRLAFKLGSSRLDELIQVASVEDKEVLSTMRESLDFYLEATESIEEIASCVVSLSGEEDLLSQWRAYCRDGGYCMEFDTSSLLDLRVPSGFELLQCKYEHSDHMKLIDSQIEKALSEYRSHISKSKGDGVPNDGIDFAVMFGMFAPLVKDRSFSEENEWRLLSGSNITDPFLYRQAGSMPVPYREISIEPMPLTKVLVGPMPHQDLAARSVRGLLKRHGVKDCTVEKSSTPYRKL